MAELIPLLALSVLALLSGAALAAVIYAERGAKRLAEAQANCDHWRREAFRLQEKNRVLTSERDDAEIRLDEARRLAEALAKTPEQAPGKEQSP